jgi:hypothetical protein
MGHGLVFGGIGLHLAPIRCQLGLPYRPPCRSAGSAQKARSEPQGSGGGHEGVQILAAGPPDPARGAIPEQ